VANSGSATSNGFELTTAYWLTHSLRVGFNAGYSDATIDQDQPSLNALKGEPLPLSAKFSDTVTIDYTHALPHDSTLQLSGVWRYVGPRNTVFLGQPGAARLSSYTSADLSAGVSHGRWTANLFVRNLWNEYAFLNTGGFADAPILTPRTIGLSLDARF
jgi:outer membrane receptor protein involved in Fe transport